MRTQARRGKVMKLTMKRIYTGVSYLCGWFDKNPVATLIFAAYVVFLYVCVFLVYRTRRRIDDKLLNDELQLFKTRDKSR